MSADRGPQLFAVAEQRLLGASDVPSSDLGVYTVIVGLMAVGVVLILIAAWLFRATKPELELLAPLERMSDRSWKKLDPAMQRRALDDLRPSGARPIERATGLPRIDEDFAKAVPDIADFDDLRSMQAADVRRQASSGKAAPHDDTVHEEHPQSAVATADQVDDTEESTQPDLLDREATPAKGVGPVSDAVVTTEPGDDETREAAPVVMSDEDHAEPVDRSE